MDYVERAAERRVSETSKSFPVVAVCGMRQAGKSTMLNHIKGDDRTFVTLDNGPARRLAEEDPGRFLDFYKAPLIIDEFQRVPSLSLELKYVVDKRLLDGDDSVFGSYWITGSQKFEMMKGLTESMAGRCAVLELSSLSSAEIDGRDAGLFHPDAETLRKRAEDAPKRSPDEIFERIFEGGMPAYVAGSASREDYFVGYVNTYLEHDVYRTLGVDKLDKFERFLTYLACNPGMELNVENIGNAVEISSATVKGWLSVLEASGIVYVLRPYHDNAIKRLVKKPKIYFMDTGLCSYLAEFDSAKDISRNRMAGEMLETYAVSEIVKSYQGAGKRPDLCYYRDSAGREIDLLVHEGDRIYPIEIRNAKYPENAAKNVHALESTGLEVMPCTIICLSDRFLPCDRDSFYFPVYAL